MGARPALEPFPGRQGPGYDRRAQERRHLDAGELRPAGRAAGAARLARDVRRPLMLVFCNGMPRSGSTWSFNVVLGLLRRSFPGEEIQHGYSEAPVEFLKATPPAASHVVMKCHFLTPMARTLVRTEAAKVVYTGAISRMPLPPGSESLAAGSKIACGRGGRPLNCGPFTP